MALVRDPLYSFNSLRGLNQIATAGSGLLRIYNTAPKLLIQHEQSGLVVTGHPHLVPSSRSSVLLFDLFGDEPLEFLLGRPIALLSGKLEQHVDRAGHRPLMFQHTLEEG